MWMVAEKDAMVDTTSGTPVDVPATNRSNCQAESTWCGRSFMSLVDGIETVVGSGPASSASSWSSESRADLYHNCGAS
jgi:hypothetical protein